WIEKWWGREPGRREHKMGDGLATFRLWRISTRANPFLPADYVRDLILFNSPAEVRRILEGEYGSSFAGKPVYKPPFAFESHVGLPPTHPVALVRIWDFGYRRPAVTWHQFIKCKFGTVHWNILREYVPENLESEVLAEHVLRLSAEMFPEI